MGTGLCKTKCHKWLSKAECEVGNIVSIGIQARKQIKVTQDPV